MKLPKNALYYSFNILKQFGPLELAVENANSLAYKKFQQSELYSDDKLKTSVGGPLSFKYETTVFSILYNCIATINC